MTDLKEKLTGIFDGVDPSKFENLHEIIPNLVDNPMTIKKHFKNNELWGSYCNIVEDYFNNTFIPELNNIEQKRSPKKVLTTISRFLSGGDYKKIDHDIKKFKLGDKVSVATRDYNKGKKNWEIANEADQYIYDHYTKDIPYLKFMKIYYKDYNKIKNPIKAQNKRQSFIGSMLGAFTGGDDDEEKKNQWILNNQNTKLDELTQKLQKEFPVTEKPDIGKEERMIKFRDNYPKDNTLPEVSLALTNLGQYKRPDNSADEEIVAKLKETLDTVKKSLFTKILKKQMDDLSKLDTSNYKTTIDKLNETYKEIAINNAIIKRLDEYIPQLETKFKKLTKQAQEEEEEEERQRKAEETLRHVEHLRKKQEIKRAAEEAERQRAAEEAAELQREEEEKRQRAAEEAAEKQREEEAKRQRELDDARKKVAADAKKAEDKRKAEKARKDAKRKAERAAQLAAAKAARGEKALETIQKRNAGNYKNTYERIKKIKEKLNSEDVSQPVRERIWNSKDYFWLNKDGRWVEITGKEFYDSFEINDSEKESVNLIIKAIFNVKNHKNEEMLKRLWKTLETLNRIDTDYEDITGIGRVYVRIKGDEPSDRVKKDDKGENIVFSYCNEVSNFQKSYELGAVVDKKQYMVKDTSGNKDVIKSNFGPYTKVFTDRENSKIYNEQIDSASIQDTTWGMLSASKRKDMYNILLFAFGSSGSGKTFTLLGEKENGKWNDNKGLAVLSIETLIGEFRDYFEAINVKAIQLYRNIIYDPLSETLKNPVTIVQAGKKESHKDGVKTVRIQDVSELIGKTYDQIKGIQAKLIKDSKEIKGLTDVLRKAQGKLKKQIDALDLQMLKYFNVSEEDMVTDQTTYPEQSTEALSADEFKKQVIDKLVSKKISSVNDFETVADEILKNRFTRSTPLNPESSRSHLFIFLEFLMNDEEGNAQKPVYYVIGDLAGMEDPHIYTGRAQAEGLYIRNTLGKDRDFQTILGNYAQGKKVDLSGPDISENAIQRNSDTIKKKYGGTHTKVKGFDSKKSAAVYNTMNFILNNALEGDTKITESPTKLLTFMTVKNNDKNLPKAYCTDTLNTLLLAEKFTGKTLSSSFGRSSRAKKKSIKKSSVVVKKAKTAARKTSARKTTKKVEAKKTSARKTTKTAARKTAAKKVVRRVR